MVTFLFLFRLDYNTLVSWDEAWYGAIAREMLASGDFLRMHFNSVPYYDHPPLGFWLIAFCYKLFDRLCIHACFLYFFDVLAAFFY